MFEQVWCAENFKLFKAQMIRKNVELELQALVLLQYQLGIIRSDKNTAPHHGNTNTTNNNNNNNSNDDEIMAIVIKKSKDEYDSLMKSRQQSKSSSSAANYDLPVRKPQDLEIAKKLVNSNLKDDLRQELNQQENINRKLVEDELHSSDDVVTKKIASTNAYNNERPMSAAKRSVVDLDSRMQAMKFEEADRGRRPQSGRKNRPNDDDSDDDDIVGKRNSHKATNMQQNMPLQNNITQSILVMIIIDKYIF